MVEGEVIVERGHNDEGAPRGRSVRHTPLHGSRADQDEIAWSRNAADHIKILQEMVAFKEKLRKSGCRAFDTEPSA